MDRTIKAKSEIIPAEENDEKQKAYTVRVTLDSEVIYEVKLCFVKRDKVVTHPSHTQPEPRWVGGNVAQGEDHFHRGAYYRNIYFTHGIKYNLSYTILLDFVPTETNSGLHSSVKIVKGEEVKSVQYDLVSLGITAIVFFAGGYLLTKWTD